MNGTQSSPVMDDIKPLRILMVAASPFPANHGGAASIREMSDVLVRLGHEVHVICYPVQEDIPIGDITVHRVHIPFMRPGKVKVGPAWEKFLYNPLMILKLIAIILRYRIDVIHAHNYEGAMIGWAGKILTGRPMLYNAVNTMADELPSYNFIKPRALAVWLGRVLDYWVPRMGNLLTVVSDALRDFLIEQGIKPDRIVTLPAGVHLDMFDGGDGARMRERHALGDAPLVMYTGALEAFQRIDYLLAAMKDVVAAVPSAKLLIVGGAYNPAQADKYQAMAESLGIAAHVMFAHSVPLAELADYLNAADVAVVPRPDCPGHPVKLLNYMAAARPIVSFEGGAKGLRHMHNGCLAKDHDSAELAHWIVFLLQNRDIANTLGQRARATIDGNFDWLTLGRGISVLYQSMVAREPAINRAQLERYIRPGYVLLPVERRNQPATAPDERRRSNDRRVQDRPIDFIERRQVAFGAAPEHRDKTP